MPTKGFDYPYRVFISYAHMDIELVEKIASIFSELGLQPLWDRDIRPGTTFTESIKDLIKRSHLFVPIITENSQNRPWVHQETGYAIALNIPVLPFAIGNLPGEMLASLQAISVKPNLEDFAEQLLEINLEELVIPESAKPHDIIEIADWPEARTEMLVRYAKWVLESGNYGYVRHQSFLTSFSIPDKPINDPIWDSWKKTPSQSDYLSYLQRQERQLLERHARIAGCTLLFDPTEDPSVTDWWPALKRNRLLTLLQFIASMPPDKLRIVISHKALGSNIIIVGDYFVAESAAPRQIGYRQTIFNSHPPTVLQKIRQFDREFEELYATEGVSVEEACERLQQIADEIEG